jgi:hypothetical protein
VILVDADLRRPGLHMAFGIDNFTGLADVLAGNVAPAEVLQPGPLPRLRLLTAGPAAGSAADLLEGPRLARTLRALQKLCDVVVLDSAPLLSLSDGIALAALSDHVLLVGDYRRTTRAYVSRALAELGDVVDGNVSAVLLSVPKSAGGLTPRGRDQAITAPVEIVDPTVLLAAEKEPEPDPGRGAAPFGPPVIPAPTSPASTLYSSKAANGVKPPDEPRLPHQRTELERHS